MTVIGNVPPDTLNVTASGATTARAIQDKLSDKISVKDFGATGNGSTDDSGAFQRALNARNSNAQGDFYVNKGNYNIGSGLTWPVGIRMRVDPAVVFNNGANLNLASIVPYSIGPVLSYDIGFYSLNTSGYGNVFINATTVYQSGPSNTVAVFGEGLAQSAVASTWGSNFAGITTVDGGANAIGVEVNPVNVGGNGSNAFGVVIASAGTYNSRAAIQIQNNTPSSSYQNGILFNNPGGSVAISTLLLCQGGSPSNGVYFNGTSFGYAAFSSNNFRVDPNGVVTGNGFNNSSDARLKTKITKVTEALGLIMKLQPKIYTLIADKKLEPRFGFIAHEAKEVIKHDSFVRGQKDGIRIVKGAVFNVSGELIAESVEKNAWEQMCKGKLASYPSDSIWKEAAEIPDYQTLDLTQLVPLLVASVQEMTQTFNKRIDDLTKRVQELKTSVRSA